MKVYWTGLERYSGLYSGIHSLAHSSFIVIPLCLLYIENIEMENARNTIIKVLIIFLIISALFCIFKSYTRTTWIGSFILINYYLYAKKKFYLIALILIVIIFFGVISNDVKKAFLDISEPLSGQDELRKIGSSRFGIWADIIDIIKANGFVRLILGLGLTEYSGITSYHKSGSLLAISHNDFLGLLLTLGLVGISIYIASLIQIIYDITKSPLHENKKSIFIGFIFSVLLMNFLSNSYISRIESAQYYYFIIGCFYIYKDNYAIGQERLDNLTYNQLNQTLLCPIANYGNFSRIQ